LGAAGVGKHVLVEKPMAMSAEQSRRMIDACDNADVKLFVAYYRRFYPQVQKMKELIADGAIGTPVQAFIEFAANISGCEDWRETPEISGGGRFVDLVSHRIDAMAYLLGDLDSAVGIATTFDSSKRVEQLVSAAMRFTSGAQCAVTGDFHTGRTEDRFRIVGTKSAIVSDVLDQPVFRLERSGGVEEFRFEPLAAPHLGLVRHIEDVLLRGAENESSGRDGLITEHVLDAAVRKPLGLLS
jgi:predicted dehydrogenase